MQIQQYDELLHVESATNNNVILNQVLIRWPRIHKKRQEITRVTKKYVLIWLDLCFSVDPENCHEVVHVNVGSINNVKNMSNNIQTTRAPPRIALKLPTDLSKMWKCRTTPPRMDYPWISTDTHG